jgi:hypothetical protein
MDLFERECKTPGTFYDTKYTDHEIDVSVRLPDEVSIENMDDEQGDRFDDMIHDGMEEIVAKMVDEIDSDADKHWAEAKKNDQGPEGQNP